jgi:hypothetical protein
LGLTYHNIRGLHNVVDKLPSRAKKWQKAKLSFSDSPEDQHFIQYRDPVEAIRSLFADPAHTNDIVYKPKKMFANLEQKDKKNRIYSEMWTGKWWNIVQVLINSIIIVSINI